MRLLYIIFFYIIFSPFLTLAQEQQQKENDVIILGQAVYDTIFKTTERELLPFVQAQEMYIGDSRKVSYNVIQELEQSFVPIMTAPGGSAANMAYALGVLDAKVGFYSVSSTDAWGTEFVKSLTNVGVKDFTRSIENADQDDSKTISRVLVFITPTNAERTMFAYDGISTDFNKVEFDFSEVQNYKVAYIEGYIFSDLNKKFIFNFIKFAKSLGLKIAFSPSSTHLINSYRNDFIKIANQSDILFTRPAEISALFDGAESEHSLKKLAAKINTIVMTMGEEGAVIVQGAKRITIPPMIQDKKNIIDTTGAGDGFAAGFLYGYTHGYDIENSGKLGAYIAAAALKQLSARPSKEMIQKSMSEFLNSTKVQ
ncbi:Adenosine kinase [Candidatus Trichorickettsia mobilis]|uniref:Adenosine kinase n=1 Tax=Candidatus Trichorickettsia mobilis TaxID=1346319 RepID=A0ABZ0UTM7_9RICK|nr:adenosine kinase [Candidatus Trichorickettsia mobilis]WPY01400.1 Adenosine kinase [Candidatus Trichorickettsia mobilis]